MRARPHNYPDENSEYTDTTYYREEGKYLDVGYQRLKELNLNRYPCANQIKILHVDYNNLTSLPDSNYLHNLTELKCSHNKLKNIPFYPGLTYLDISHNQITSLSNYDNCKLTYFDCSYNQNFNFNIKLPVCTHLFINNVGIYFINFDNIPRVKILDISFNNIRELTDNKNLIEMDIQSNKISKLPSLPKIEIIIADHNNIEMIETYPSLTILSVSYNKITNIAQQPKLKKLVANNNNITHLTLGSNMTSLELQFNQIREIYLPDKIKYASIQFNPITKLTFSIKELKELHIDYKLYTHMYEKYHQYFGEIEIKPSSNKLCEIFAKELSISEELKDFLISKIKKIDFIDRYDSFAKIIVDMIPNKEKKKDFMKSEKFFDLAIEIENIYNRSVTVAICFEKYFNPK